MPEKTNMKLFSSGLGDSGFPDNARDPPWVGSGTHRGWGLPVLRVPTLSHMSSFIMKEWFSETLRLLLGVTQCMGIGDWQRTGSSASTAQVSLGEFPEPNPTLSDSTA